MGSHLRYGWPSGKGRTVVSEAEREDPLCRWMIMSCTDKKNLLVDNVVEDDGSMSWGVKDVTDSYKLEAKKWKNTSVLNRDALKKDVLRRFERFDYYRRLEIRDTDISDQAKREWIEEKNKMTSRRLTFACWLVNYITDKQNS